MSDHAPEEGSPITEIDFSQAALVPPEGKKSSYYRTTINGAQGLFSPDAETNTWLFTRYGLTDGNTFNKNIKASFDIHSAHPDAKEVLTKKRGKMSFFLNHTKESNLDIIEHFNGIGDEPGAIESFRCAIAQWLVDNFDTDETLQEYVRKNGRNVDTNSADEIYAFFYQELVSYAIKETKTPNLTIMNVSVPEFTKFFDLGVIQEAAQRGVEVDWTDGSDETLLKALIPRENLVYTSFEAIPIMHFGNFEFTRARMPNYRLNINLELASAIVRPVARRNAAPGHRLFAGLVSAATEAEEPAPPIETRSRTSTASRSSLSAALRSRA